MGSECLYSDASSYSHLRWRGSSPSPPSSSSICTSFPREKRFEFLRMTIYVRKKEDLFPGFSLPQCCNLCYQRRKPICVIKAQQQVYFASLVYCGHMVLGGLELFLRRAQAE